MKIIDKLVIDNNVLRNVDANQLQKFLNVSCKPTQLVKYARKYHNKEELVMHFKDTIVIPKMLVMEYLNCNINILKTYKQQLGYAFSVPIRIGIREYYTLNKVLDAKEIIDDLKLEYQNKVKLNRKNGAKKAIQTRIYRKNNTPDWIKSNNCTFERNVILNEVKKSIVLAKLNHSDVAYTNKLTFGKIQYDVIITIDNRIKFQVINSMYKFSKHKHFEDTITLDNKIEQKINHIFKKNLIDFYFKNLEFDNDVLLLKSDIYEATL